VIRLIHEGSPGDVDQPGFVRARCDRLGPEQSLGAVGQGGGYDDKRRIAHNLPEGIGSDDDLRKRPIGITRARQAEAVDGDQMRPDAVRGNVALARVGLL